MSLNWRDYPEGLFLFYVLFGLCSPLQLCICPHRTKDGVAVQHFTFVLTDLNGSQRFGFCRLTNSSSTCLCILRYRCVVLKSFQCCRPGCRLNHILFDPFDRSYLPWFEVFYKLLNNLADYLAKGQVRCQRVPVCVSLLFFTGRISHQTCRILNRSRR